MVVDFRGKCMGSGPGIKARMMHRAPTAERGEDTGGPRRCRDSYQPCHPTEGEGREEEGGGSYDGA
ncbi:MAG: hypothetical protein D8M59_01445 [Planctomycetes bacterium]|nr:hypothetical protein [Planctomycetota bacterium]